MGKFLSNCPLSGEGEVWPSSAVCKAIEDNYSEELRDGFVVAVLNSRGTYSPNRGDNAYNSEGI